MKKFKLWQRCPEQEQGEDDDADEPKPPKI
jgi:hypothetical protein